MANNESRNQFFLVLGAIALDPSASLRSAIGKSAAYAVELLEERGMLTRIPNGRTYHYGISELGRRYLALCPTIQEHDVFEHPSWQYDYVPALLAFLTHGARGAHPAELYLLHAAQNRDASILPYLQKFGSPAIKALACYLPNMPAYHKDADSLKALTRTLQSEVQMLLRDAGIMGEAEELTAQSSDVYAYIMLIDRLRQELADKR
jgi:hypothetical protein